VLGLTPVARGFVDASMREQGRDCLLLLGPNFAPCPFICHGLPQAACLPLRRVDAVSNEKSSIYRICLLVFGT